MKILILNWRDIKNPESGGAEILTHEMAKRWAARGHSVTQFSAMFTGSKKDEIIDGVTIIRDGTANIRSLGLPVHLAAFVWFLKNSKEKFEIVIDEIHGIPFFTPWYIKTKKIALICEVADTIWDAIFSFPLNIIGKTIEKIYFRFYKNTSFLTISPSTKKELLEKGIEDKNITIIPMGLSIPNRKLKFSKEKNLTLIFVGRLTKAKGIEAALQVTANLKSKYPQIHLWVVGQGDPDYIATITDLARQLRIKNQIHYFGFVSQAKKFELMARAHLLIVPSIKEGWGLTIPEAGYVGTPAVAYNVEGLRDIIVQNKTGLLVSTSVEDMTRGIIKVFSNQNYYRHLQKNVKKISQKYNWDQTADVALTKLGEI